MKTPDLIVSVFSNTPKLIVNDDGWTFSNSLLGGYLSDGVSATDFAETWYTAITLLSIEIEVHSLGGGVLVVVPNEADKIHKLSVSCATGDKERLQKISDCLENEDVLGAYHVGDSLIARVFGHDSVQEIWDTISALRRWRNKG